PRRYRSGNRPDPYDRGRDDRRRIDDQAAGIAGIAVSLDGLHPRFPRQRALSSRQTGERMAGATGMPDQAAFPPRLLPTSEPDRAAMGRHAQEHHAQQDLWHLQGIRRGDPGFPEKQSPPKLGQISQHSYGQFSCDIAEEISGYRVKRVYL